MKQFLDLIQRSPSCSGLVSGAVFDCENPPVPGVRKRVIIGSIDQIAEKTFDPANPLLLTAIRMIDGEQCFEFDGAKNSILPSVDLREGTNANNYGHSLGLSIFELGSDQKANIMAMAHDRMFAIVENANDSSLEDSVFEVYGLGGMEINELNRTPTDPDTLGAYVLNMQTPEAYGGEPKIPVSYDAGGYEATLLAIDVLLAPAVPIP